MKKFLFTLVSIAILGITVKSQTTAPSPKEVKESEFDKTFRFGLRITPQPTWFASNDKNNLPYGANFGFGFGLNMEYKFSEIAAFQFGVGGDFEGGKYTFKYDDQGGYLVKYWQDKSGNFITPKNGNASNVVSNPNNTGYLLKERDVKTTFVTIPLILKLSTKEYSGMKYFGMFGGEIGIRTKAVAKDFYYNSYAYDANGIVTTSGGESSQDMININKETWPVRFGLNVGAGTEYRLAGSTAFFVSINYFHSFTNFMNSESKYMVSNVNKDLTAGTENYSFVKQNLLLNAIRINLGILF